MEDLRLTHSELLKPNFKSSSVKIKFRTQQENQEGDMKLTHSELLKPNFKSSNNRHNNLYLAPKFFPNSRITRLRRPNTTPSRLDKNKHPTTRPG